jgi:hypothetical protein
MVLTFLLIPVIIFFCFCHRINSFGKEQKSGHRPGVSIDGFICKPVVSFPYGNDIKQIGFDKDIKTGKIHASSGQQYSSGIDSIFDKEGTPYLFDCFNNNIKIFNKDFSEINRIIKIKGFKMYYPSPKFDINHRNLFIAYRARNYSVSEYIGLNMLNGSVAKESIKDFLAGSNLLILKNDKEFISVSSFIRKLKSKNKNLVYSFSVDNNGCIYISVLNKGEVTVFKQNNDKNTFDRIFTAQCQDKIKKFEAQENRVFCSTEKIYVFTVYSRNLIYINGGYRLKGYGECHIINKQNPSEFRSYRTGSSDMDYLAVYDDKIYTWDDNYLGNNFTIYLLDGQKNTGKN